MTSTIPNAAPDSELFDALRLELRRGCLAIAVLAQLRYEQYGYTLRKALAEDGLVIDESTLYPLLRRLESQGLLLSEWREENKRNKRFYRLSSAGAQVLIQLLEEWRAMSASLERILIKPFQKGGQKDAPTGEPKLGQSVARGFDRDSDEKADKPLAQPDEPYRKDPLLLKES